jgi:hypothetical protein
MAWSPPARQRRSWLVEQAGDYATFQFHHLRDGTASVTADGAYDGEPVYQVVITHQSDPVPDIVIPPRASAVPSAQSAEAQSQRDHHLRIIAEKGRMAWQKATGYGRRSLVETAIGRYM